MSDEKQTKHTPNDCICGKRPTILGKAHIAVLCVHCSRSGAGFPTEEAAIADWNRQTAAPGLLEACKAMVAYSGDCLNDLLNPCWDNRSEDQAGKHWGGGDACAVCTAKAYIAKAGPKP